MIKIVIDTNVFLDFYDTHTESIKVLEELKKNASNVVLPKLVYEEFLRSKNRLIDSVISNFEKSKPKKHYSSAMIQNLPIFKELENAWDNYSNYHGNVVKELRDMKNNQEQDVVFKYVEDMFRSNEVEKIEYDDSIIEKAKRRHILGHPPGTDEKTIGDEVIWETILVLQRWILTVDARFFF